MAKKVYVDAGHGGSDPGAKKYVTEKVVNLDMALACRDYLKANGVEVKMSRTTDKDTDLNKMCSDANAWGADLAVSIHNNAGGGDGFEVFYSVVGGNSKTLAKNIEKEVKKLGQNSRGTKVKKGTGGADYFGFIRMTSMPAVICEGAFVDNKTDVKAIDTKAERKEFGYAYARGILKTLKIADKGLSGGKTTTKPAVTTKPAEKANLVKVSTETVDIVKEPPITLEVVRKCPVGVYTILEEKNGYGKLKSGEGWIKMSDVKKV